MTRIQWISQLSCSSRHSPWWKPSVTCLKRFQSFTTVEQRLLLPPPSCFAAISLVVTHVLFLAQSCLNKTSLPHQVWATQLFTFRLCCGCELSQIKFWKTSFTWWNCYRYCWINPQSNKDSRKYIMSIVY